MDVACILCKSTFNVHVGLFDMLCADVPAVSTTGRITYRSIKTNCSCLLSVGWGHLLAVSIIKTPCTTLGVCPVLSQTGMAVYMARKTAVSFSTALLFTCSFNFCVSYVRQLHFFRHTLVNSISQHSRNLFHYSTTACPKHQPPAQVDPLCAGTR